MDHFRKLKSSDHRQISRSTCSVIVWTCLLILMAVQLPLFVQQTLTPDTVLYDLQAQRLLNGGVLYRDIVEPNLPGIVWVHAAVRSIIGWSSQALLLFDLMMVTTIGFLLARLVVSNPRRNQEQKTTFAFTFAGVMTFYLSTSEWCHCQRDTWMLLPCLIAVTIRFRALEAVFITRTAITRDAISRNSRRLIISGLLEGICWAAGFWLKPIVAVPALAVLLMSLRASPGFKAWSLQTLFVVIGGLLIGVAGIAWMMYDGCWPYFWDQLTHWNSDYFQAGRSRWTLERFVAHAGRFQPWIWLHSVAIGIILCQLVSYRRGRSGERNDDVRRADVAGDLLCSLYIGWIFQAFFLQQLFDYIHVAGLILAWAICLRAAIGATENSSPSHSDGKRLAFPVLIAFLGIAVLLSPLNRMSRLRFWPDCARACFGSTLSSEARDQLAQFPFPRWVELQPMLDYLRRQGGDTWVLPYNGNLIHLYPELRMSPATRFVYLDVLARSFPSRRDEMIAAIEKSGVRFVVSDLKEDGWEAQLETATLLPKALQRRRSDLCFPYNQTPVFRSGGYVLFRIDSPIERLSDKYVPLSLIK